MAANTNALLFVGGLRVNSLTTAMPVRHLNKTLWQCICDCGRIVIVAPSALLAGKRQSCGCTKSKRQSERNTIHGKSKSPVFNSWRGMVDRCTNKNTSHFSHYGGRGISVCDRWRSFSNFYADMGDRPDGMTLDRIDVNGNYEPCNCRWASKVVQATNQRTNVLLSRGGVTKPVSVWASELNIRATTIYGRLRRGWPPEKALSKE